MKKNVKSLRSKSFSFTRLVALAIMLVFIVPVKTNAQTDKTNFSGSWEMNKEKSTLGDDGGHRMGGNFVATQDANLLTVERTRTGQDGKTSTFAMKYTLDGKECINTSNKGESKSVATWSADGKSLKIATSRTRENNGETKVMTSTEEWTLTDAKTLTVNATRQAKNGEEKTTIVYDKK